MNDILSLLAKNPTIKPRTNDDIVRNEGYLKSLRSENQSKGY